MEFKFIDKTFYDELAPKIFELASFHARMRPDLFTEQSIMTKKQFKKRIKIKNFVGIAAYENNILCGYCFCRIKNFKSKESSNSNALWIDEFFVCEEFRKQGYGTRLFEEIKKVAKENSCNIIELDVWEFNETAKQFYDSIGFRNQRITKEFLL